MFVQPNRMRRCTRHAARRRRERRVQRLEMANRGGGGGSSLVSSRRGDDDSAPRLCAIYVHDPGARFNVRAMADPRERWGDVDHYLHIPYCGMQALLEPIPTHRILCCAPLRIAPLNHPSAFVVSLGRATPGAETLCTPRDQTRRRRSHLCGSLLPHAQPKGAPAQF